MLVLMMLQVWSEWMEKEKAGLEEEASFEERKLMTEEENRSDC